MIKKKTPVRSSKRTSKLDGLKISASAMNILTNANVAVQERALKQVKGMAAILSNNDAALIKVLKHGAEIIGSRDNFIIWLNQKSIPLGGKTPLKLLLSNKAQQVLDELVRIDYGICV